MKDKNNLIEKEDTEVGYEDIKKKVVKRYYCEKIHGHALAKEIGISTTTLGAWVHQYLEHVKKGVNEEKKKIEEIIEIANCLMEKEIED